MTQLVLGGGKIGQGEGREGREGRTRGMKVGIGGRREVGARRVAWRRRRSSTDFHVVVYSIGYPVASTYIFALYSKILNPQIQVGFLFCFVLLLFDFFFFGVTKTNTYEGIEDGLDHRRRIDC